MLEIREIRKTYGNNTVLDISTLKVVQGEVFGLVGNNGAGKTTLFHIILDLVRATDGAVYLEGNDVSKTEDWKKITGSFVDEKFLIGYLTAKEYFAFLAKVHGLGKEDLNQYLAQFEELFNDEVFGSRKYIRDLSKGNKKKVGIAGALLGSPQFVILDEPFENLDPTSQIRLKKIIADYQKNGDVTFMISSHDLNQVIELCTRIVLLEKGEVKMDEMASDATSEKLRAYFRGNAELGNESVEEETIAKKEV